jgi:hypothetical protein
MGFFKQNKGAKNCVVFSGTAFSGFFSQYVDKAYIHEWNPETLAKVITDIRAQYLSLPKDRRADHHSLIVLDDLIGSANWRSPMIQHLISCHRHYGISIFLTTQYPNSIPPIIRECSKLALIFHQTTKRSIVPLFESYGSHFNSLREFTDYLSALPKYCFVLVKTDEPDMDKKYFKTKVPDTTLRFFYRNIT